MNKFFKGYKYTKKWHLYSDYVALLCSSILLYRNWFYEADAFGTVIWMLIAGLSLYRLKYNNGKFNDGK